MIYNLEDYEEYVRGLLKKVPLMRTEQLKICLRKTFVNMPEDVTQSILVAIQRRGYLLMSVDGWTMTKGIYVELTGDNAFKNHLSHGPFRLQEMNEICKNRNKKIVDLMWLIADLSPSSEDFFFATSPWDIAFVDEGSEDKQSKIYEIIYVPERSENAKAEALRLLPKMEHKDDRAAITRIAVMENANHEWKIPHKGFKFIVQIDHDSPKHYRVVKKREGEEVWSDE